MLYSDWLRTFSRERCIHSEPLTISVFSFSKKAWFSLNVIFLKNFIPLYYAWCQGELTNYYWVYVRSGSGLAADEIKSIGIVRLRVRFVRISGGSRGGALGERPHLIFRPNWGPKGQKKFLGDHLPPPSSQFLDDQPPPTTPPPPPPHPISRSGSGSGNDGFELSLTTEVFNVVIVFIVSVLTK